MEQLRIVVIATLLLLNSILCSSIPNVSAKFSSLLKTMVDDPVSPEFHIYGRNGFCVHANNYETIMLINKCGTWPEAERYTYYSDLTLRLKGNGKCLTVEGSTFKEGSTLIAAPCTTPPTNATRWLIRSEGRQIMHQSTGLVLSAIGGTERTRLTLEVNISSAAQTWRLDTNEAVRTAHIIGMDNLCLHLSRETEVWLGLCGTGGAEQKWLIYPDGTIRPQQSASRCLSFNNLVERRVLITTCGLSLTSERWVLTSAGTILNQHVNRALDVPGANPSLRRIEVFTPNGAANQQWRILYI